MDRTVGMIGLGIMGGAIARNLVEREWRVIGFDTDPARCAELALANVTHRRRRGSGCPRRTDHHDQPSHFPRPSNTSRRLSPIPASLRGL